ncbi:MAG: hypothetical protein EBS96_12110 [Spartobacteria bacterium]|nr:hypothetical protein [Spartobacteria bacterium]
MNLRKTDFYSATTQTQTVPQNLSAEQSAISIIMQADDVLDMAKWDQDLFLQSAHRTILKAIKETRAAGRQVNLFTIQAKLEETGKLEEIGGASALFIIKEHYPAPDRESALDFRKDLIKARRYRRAMQKLHETKADISLMTADLSDLAATLTDDDDIDNSALTIKSQCENLITSLESLTPPERIKSNIQELDYLLNGGFELGTVAVAASETSGGKSIFLLQAALNGAIDHQPGIIFSLEMTASSVISRMAACKSGHRVVSAYDHPTAEQMQGMAIGIRTIARLPITVHDQITTIDDIEVACHQGAKAGMKWIVVDYIQLCTVGNSSKAETREQQVSEVVRRLKILALKHNIVVFTASQMNDGGELRESRAVGHHADYVLHIDHSDKAAPVIRVIKNRNGERHVFAPVKMRGDISRFEGRTK